MFEEPREIEPNYMLKAEQRLQTPYYLGENAYESFIEKYKRMDKEREAGYFGYSASTAYLSVCEINKVSP